METGKHYNYFRDYEPGLGRYLQSDPLRFKGGINTFAYVGDNPLRSVDPRGLAKWNGLGRSLDVSHYGREEVSLESECKCGFKIRIKVKVTYFNPDPGMSAFGYGAGYDDNFDCPNPMAFEGPATRVSAGVSAHRGFGFSFSTLGRATSPGEWTALEGWGASAGHSFGSSEVTDLHLTPCSCSGK